MKTQFRYANLIFAPGEVIVYNDIKCRVWTVWRIADNGQTHECKMCVHPRATRSAIIEHYESFTL